LRVDKKTIYEAIKQGQIPATKIGKQFMIPRDKRHGSSFRGQYNFHSVKSTLDYKNIKHMGPTRVHWQEIHERVPNPTRHVELNHFRR
jgi:hypothetical protein